MGSPSLLALPGIAKGLNSRKADQEAGPKTVSADGTSVPLEWLGLDGPLTEEDVLVLDRTLHLSEVVECPCLRSRTSRSASAATPHSRR